MTAHSHRGGSWPTPSTPDQSGRTVLVTGASSGLGHATALAQHGAQVLLGCCHPGRGGAALRDVRAVAGDRAPQLVYLDLSDLGSVHDAARAVRERTEDHLDVLVNNAGTSTPP